MNLSARLGTAANTGLLHSRETRQPIIRGNLLLLQVQALLVSAVAAALAFVLGVLAPSKEKMPMEMPQDSPPEGQHVGNGVRLVIRLLFAREEVVRTWGSRFRECVRFRPFAVVASRV